MAETMKIEVVYALPQRQELVRLSVAKGSTVRQAVESSGLLEKFPGIDLARDKVGIFGKLAKLDTVVREDDRVEIYRPLVADPKEVRRKRAEEGKVMKKGGGPLEE
ncbi:MAG: RnfH family protein [Betaproteobacteria bacterium]|nr:RnfH family protein [Betaproteobacteria bacterium]